MNKIKEVNNERNLSCTRRIKKTARLVESEYFERYQQSIDQPNEFWAEQAHKLDWIKPFTQVKNTSFNKDNFKIEWFADGSST